MSLCFFSVSDLQGRHELHAMPFHRLIRDAVLDGAQPIVHLLYCSILVDPRLPHASDCERPKADHGMGSSSSFCVHISQVHTPEHNPEVHPTGLLGMMEPPTSIASPAMCLQRPNHHQLVLYTDLLLVGFCVCTLQTCINKMVNCQDPSLLLNDCSVFLGLCQPVLPSTTAAQLLSSS